MIPGLNDRMENEGLEGGRKAWKGKTETTTVKFDLDPGCMSHFINLEPLYFF